MAPGNPGTGRGSGDPEDRHRSPAGFGEFDVETFFTGLHALYLAHRFWRSQVSVSFPRIRPAEGGFAPRYTVSDRQMVQGICAMRLLLPDCGLTMSTRESARFRDNLIPLGITQMSAGSSTAPGGYSHKDEGTGQFNIDDDRSPEEMSRVIRAKGYEAVSRLGTPPFSRNAFPEAPRGGPAHPHPPAISVRRTAGDRDWPGPSGPPKIILDKTSPFGGIFLNANNSYIGMDPHGNRTENAQDRVDRFRDGLKRGGRQADAPAAGDLPRGRRAPATIPMPRRSSAASASGCRRCRSTPSTGRSGC